ncbi:enoyl-CoA hydratase [Pseudooceanicola batsensis HTCC2597]|uniref:Enoyl-CoA hydratase n=1 Tax=Pseudooceanicola batsensis (strain ATCC BAA-863 / DSM 15984 / KCTC 12145 / HTCC2597) TaxID=252305 RepID=A3TUH8_PSEBH|nr:enoyl-CoA hydratase-related protein [Pseudooceanicola batsensis]EAQ04174.1 enoyl-CoA hydratase [Pseudooceanicola batsensis HTCC2597]
MTDDLLIERKGGILVLTLNRPDRRNAMSRPMIFGLHDELEKAAEDPEVRAVILTGAGGAFCAGGDVKAMNEGSGRDQSFYEQRRNLRHRMDCSRLLHEMPKPTIAAIEGAAAGAGLSLALACDFRIASDTAKLTTAFAKVALSGDFGGTYFLTQILGTAKAKELYLFSPVISGKEAERIGLVTRAVDAGAALDEALTFAAPLAEGAPLALGRMKQNLNLAAGGGSLVEVMDLEADNHTCSTDTKDHREAAAAFVEKRKPAFRGS